MANVRGRWAGWSVAVALVAVTLAPGTATPTAAAGVEAPPGGFTAVTPARILDTRTGLGAPTRKIGPGQVLELQVTGRGGVPATGVSAVALNVTITQPTELGFVTVYPTGATRPVASSLNFVAGQTVPNAVAVKVGSGGRVSIFNSAGSSHLIADVAGWHATERSVGRPFTPVAPVRKLDTRESQPVAPGGTRRLALTQGLPPGTTAVAINVTVTQPSTAGYLTVHPAGEPRPTVSNLNFVAGQTRANFVAVKVSTAGAVDIVNQSGTTHVIVDLLGYWGPASSSRMSAITPTRVLDTRSGLGHPAGPVGSGQTAVLQLPGRSAVPEGMASAVVLNVTATQPTAPGYVTVYPGDVSRPVASNLNFAPGETVPNLVMVPVDAAGRVNIFNASGRTHVIVDVLGWFDFPAAQLDIDGINLFGAEVAIDPTSTYAYISNTGQNQVEVLRLSDGTLEAPILVGSEPMGLDITPDGRRLYVANRGSVFVSVIDLTTRTELRRFPVPAGSMADHPYQIATLANGKALLTTTFNGSGFGARMYEIDLGTDAVKPRQDFYHWGTTTEYTSVRASGDRRAAVITAGDISSGPVFRYDADTDTFTDEVATSTFTSAIATDMDGSATLVNFGGMVFDERLNRTGTIRGCGTNGVAVNGAGTIGYGLGYDYESHEGYVAVCDLVRFLIPTRIPIGPVNGVGRLAISPDGSTLVGIIDAGVVLVRP